MLHTVLFSPLQLFTTEILPYARPGGNIRAVWTTAVPTDPQVHQNLSIKKTGNNLCLNYWTICSVIFTLNTALYPICQHKVKRETGPYIARNTQHNGN